MFLAERAYRSLQDRRFRDDVESCASIDYAYSHDRRAERRRFATDQRLERRNHVRGDHYGVNRFMGHGSVTSLAVYCEHTSISTGIDGPGTHANMPKRVVANKMQAENAVYGLHSAFLDHGFGATEPLFCG